MPSIYYPLNYYLSRESSRRSLKLFENEGVPTNLRRSSEIVMGELLPELEKVGLELTSNGPSMAVFSQEVQGGLAWADWALRGKHIFCVQEALAHAFEHSDCSEMHIADVLPEGAETFYIHFEGKLQQPIPLADNTFFEGAYVLHHPNVSVRIVLCGRTPGAKLSLNHWRERYDLRIPSKYLNIPADAAIDGALQEDLADLQTARERVAATEPASQLQAVDLVTERMAQGHEAYRSALRLILNALAYLKTYGDDSRLAWPVAAPERLVTHATSGTPKEVARGLSKLWALGFVPITYVGDQFVQTQGIDHGRTLARMHWRRGHWRNQPHGPALSLRKLIWLRPAIIGKVAG